MMFSIITPCYLGEYRNAGKDRDRKLIRAINSAMAQDTEAEFEHLIISDGCPLTSEIVKVNFKQEMKSGFIRLVEIPKQRNFSGIPRNTGIDFAKGEWIVYLDSDDLLGTDHLQILEANLNGYDWVFFNDLIKEDDKFTERPCLMQPYRCGTSNIAHRRRMKARWKERNSYGTDDWQFINYLKSESQNWTKIPTPSYVVCHIPLRGGYDV